MAFRAPDTNPLPKKAVKIITKTATLIYNLYLGYDKTSAKMLHRLHFLSLWK